MKILIIGGYGTVGKKVTDYLKPQHEVLVAARQNGELTVDISESSSIAEMFRVTGKLDAVVCIAGEAKWARLNDLSEEDYYVGIRSKLMGQVNIVRLGQAYLNHGGSFTLTTGILAEDPVVMTTSAAMVNGALHSFVKAAALELENGQRVNVVASGLVEDAVEKYRDYFPGHLAVPMERVVNGYVRSILGKGNGEVIRVYM